ncbi:hypothetical protein EOA13_29590 [Mesorhizobium sp. M7A.F.Ca.US.011.01.1.1]|uniref:hypothetical protein n=1 Tax=Mesorhizobium sp. M7A.F.Ca.US.011.01.1.1 TaxID=2496741 RepID=UPI000FC9E4F2|nr:hypothetical protein [Mesorhizobium sp. M7A.F.Ca.US.011.01.1.1]RUX24802.1 hypothetical protein EOA13_29590 [Mesorhizobium sp. M7A.F.Ca.US.011.01.1.1]
MKEHYTANPYNDEHGGSGQTIPEMPGAQEGFAVAGSLRAVQILRWADRESLGAAVKVLTMNAAKFVLQSGFGRAGAAAASPNE